MRILFSTGSPPAYMKPPLLSDHQINCGPDWNDEINQDEQVSSLKTPSGQYDLSHFAQKIPKNQSADVVVCLVDSSFRNLPRNLSAFKCPKVLLLADTHHMQSPLTNLIKYIHSEAYDRIIVLYDRHHLEMLHSYGLNNLYWFPGLTFPHGDQFTTKARSTSQRINQIAFVGQTGQFHPRRSAQIRAFHDAHLPFNCQAYNQEDALGFYGCSSVGFNSSLNGDLNLRIFEVLASGAALLTDTLSEASGLSKLIEEGVQYIPYSSNAEMIQNARYAIENPNYSSKVGRDGAVFFDTFFNLSRRRENFKNIALDGIMVPEFEWFPSTTTRVFFERKTNLLNSAIKVYEEIQHIHSKKDDITLFYGNSVPRQVTEIFLTLSRIKLIDQINDDSAPDLSICDSNSDIPLNSKRIWVWDAPCCEIANLTERLKKNGYRTEFNDIPYFVKPPLSDEMTSFKSALERRDYARALEAVRCIIQKDGHSIHTALLFGEIAVVSRNLKLLRDTIQLALKIEPNNPNIKDLIQILQDSEATKHSEIQRLYTSAQNANNPSDLIPLFEHTINNSLLDHNEKIGIILQLSQLPILNTRTNSSNRSSSLTTSIVVYQPWFGLDYQKIINIGFKNDLFLPILTPPANQKVEKNFPITKDNFHSLNYKGIFLWPICQYRFSYLTGFMPEEADQADNFLQTISTLFSQAASLIDFGMSAIQFFKPSSVVIAQGYDFIGCVMRHIAIRQGLRVVALENIFRKDRFLWDDISGITVTRNLAKNFYWRFEEVIPQETAHKSVKTYFDSIESLKSLEHSSPKSGFHTKLFPNNKPTLLYLAQVGIDSSIIFGRLGFKKQDEILTEMAQYAIENETRLIIKLHPKESNQYKYSEPAFHLYTLNSLERNPRFLQLKSQLGENLYIDSENTLDTYQLIRESDLCVTLNSQSGLEALVLGKEVIVCGQAFYSGLGFTHEAPDAHTLRFALDNILKHNNRRNVDLASKRFFHTFTELFCLPKTEESFVNLAKGNYSFPSI